ncbi:MAG: glycine-rich protein [Solirubrobacterales bacterium]
MKRGVLPVAAIAVLALLLPGAAGAATDTFTTPGSYDWTVPAGVDSATFTVVGARGGASASSDGGLGGLVTATLSVTPGETLKVTVGGAGADTPAIAGGFNGGGLAGSQTCVIPPSTKYCNGGGGGGASDVRRGGNALTDRVLVAGGGGGAGGRSADGCLGDGCVPATARGGGDGGGGGNPGFNGSNGANGGSEVEIPNSGGCGGGGATGAAPGAAGGTVPGMCTGLSGNISGGSSGVGGRGGDAAGGGSGGGGGGGWFGGGGGSGASAVGARGGGGGGGGGSNFVTPSATGVTSTSGAGDGDGYVTITYGGAPPSPPEIALSGSKLQRLGGKVVINAKAISEPTDFEATGSVKVPGPDQVLKPAHGSAATGAKVTLELKISKQSRRKIEKALKQGKDPVAELEVTGTDADGDETTLTRSVKIRK